MRPLLVFSDVSIRPSFLFTVPARKSRTECGCHPEIFDIAAIVAPPLLRSRPRMLSCLVAPPEARDTFVAFSLALDRLLGLERELAFAFVIGTSEVGDTIVAPPRPR